MENKFFYCYSKRLKDFISAFGIRYITCGIKETSGRRFWQFEKSQKLDDVIAFWNTVKFKFNDYEEKLDG